MFVDETWFNTQMSRYWGWAQKGEKIPEAIPAGHWRSFTLLGAMTHSGLLATMTLEDSTDTDVFLTFLEQILCPKLQPGHIVVMDNLSAHKAPAVREKIEATGATLLYLPAYSPDLNPIEKCWAKIKLILRTLKARTAEALDPAISEAITAISPQDATGWLHHCGYRYSKC